MKRLTKTQILYIANARSHGEISLCEKWLSDAGGRIHPEDQKLIDEKASYLRRNPLTPDELKLIEL